MGAAERIEPVLLGVAAKCLRVAPEMIDLHAPLARYGLDSLSALELCVALGEATGIEIGEDDLIDSPSIHALAQRMVAAKAPAVQVDRRLERMLADARLPEDIQPGSVQPSAGGAVLLTGATGFLGVHLLKALATSGASTIICPVRSRDDRHARSRIDATLHRYGLLIPELSTRAVALAADLNDPCLGRSVPEYQRLAHQVSTIVHCAADVNWTLSYEGLRAANVLLTENLLRFAARGARKRFHFISSLAACYSTRAQLPATETGAAPDLVGIHLGYAQSKWVAERLVEACADRGLQAALYRPSLITGDSASGIGNDDDLLAQLMRGVIALGYAPDLDWRLDACPVDYVAQAIARAAGAPGHAPQTLHLRNPQPARWAEAVLWMNVRGYPVALEPFAAWIERVEHASRDPQHVLHRLRGFLLSRPQGENGRTLPEIYADPAVARVDAQRSDALIASLGLQCPRLGARLLERTFDAWVERGVLPEVSPRRVRACNAPVLDDADVEKQLRQYFADPCLRLIASRRRDFGFEHSILGELASWRAGSAIAMHAQSVEMIRGDSKREMLEIVVKPKYADAVVLAVAEQVAALCGAALGQAFAAHGEATGLAGSAQRELGVYARATGALRGILPKCYGVIEAGGYCTLLLERVGEGAGPDHVNQPAAWTPARVEAALRTLGRVHGEWLERKPDVSALLGGEYPGASMLDAQPLWLALSAYAQPQLRAWIGTEGARLQSGLADAAHGWLAAHACLPRTLIHHDLNPRNFIVSEDAAGARLFAFDWELAEYGLAQRDVIEMLCFVLSADASAHHVQRLVEVHRVVTQTAAGIALDASQWSVGVRLALADFGIRRLPMYFMADRFRPHAFLQRVTRTWLRLAQLFGLGTSERIIPV